MPQFDLISFFNESYILVMFFSLWAIFLFQFILPIFITIFTFRVNYLEFLSFFLK